MTPSGPPPIPKNMSTLNLGSETNKAPRTSPSVISLIFFLFLFYFTSLMVEEAFVKNYTTGTVWSPPLWIPYSSMLIGALLMILQYIAEILKLFKEESLI